MRPLFRTRRRSFTLITAVVSAAIVLTTSIFVAHSAQAASTQSTSRAASARSSTAGVSGTAGVAAGKKRTRIDTCAISDLSISAKAVRTSSRRVGRDDVRVTATKRSTDEYWGISTYYVFDHIDVITAKSSASRPTYFSVRSTEPINVRVWWLRDEGLGNKFWKSCDLRLSPTAA